MANQVCFLNLAEPTVGLFLKIRYGLSCPVSLQYPLYHAPNPISETLTLTSSSGSVMSQETNHHQTPMAYLVVENIKLEVGREFLLIELYLSGILI